MAYVIVEIELGIVDPHRMIEERHLGNALPVARHHFKRPLVVVEDTLEVQAALSVAQGRRIEEHDCRLVPVRVPLLEAENRGIESREPVEIRVRHRQNNGVTWDLAGLQPVARRLAPVGVAD